MAPRTFLVNSVISAAVLLATSSVWSTQALAVDSVPRDHASHMQASQAVVPTMPGQDAFGAVQEIIRILEADPQTNWNKVNLDALREHLIDMNEVTLHAQATSQDIDHGLSVAVTGEGRTLDAIRRMIPAHGREINGLRSWRVTSEPLSNGARLSVTADDPREVAHIRGLGFIGIMASGAHHQPHHLAIARGEAIHDATH